MRRPSAFHFPGFSLESWLGEMVEEGVYLERAGAGGLSFTWTAQLD